MVLALQPQHPDAAPTTWAVELMSSNERSIMYFDSSITVSATISEIMRYSNYKASILSSRELLEGDEQDYILATGEGLWLESGRLLASYYDASVAQQPTFSPQGRRRSMSASEPSSISAPASLSSSPSDLQTLGHSALGIGPTADFAALLSNLTTGSLQLIRPGTRNNDEKMRKQIENAMRQFETQQMPTFIPGETQLWKRENVTCSAPPLPRVKGQLYITNYQLIFFCYERSTCVCRRSIHSLPRSHSY